MKKIIQTLLFSICFTISISLYSQNLIGSTDLGIVMKNEISSSFDVDALFDLQLYKILYETPDVHGVTDTASGLLLLPISEGAIFPLLNYQHGTVADRHDVPSNLEGGYELAAVLASQGYVTAAPDYLGMGESRGIHPYVHADSEASAAIDMLFATRMFVEQTTISLNDQLFITGYSQGGHSAMAAHRALELEYANDFTVTASAPMSGPYSISEKTLEFTMGDNPYLFPAYIVATALSYQEAYENLYEDLGEFFKPQYMDGINAYVAEEIDLIILNFTLLGILGQNGGWFTKNLLQDSIQNIILSGNFPDHPVNVALRDNDVYDWAPNAPTRLFYCTNDDQVTFENAILAEEVMNANGATDLDAVDVGPSFNHGQCVEPATQATIDFFAGFQTFTTGVKHIDADRVFSIQPNPAEKHINISKGNYNLQNAELRLMDVNGKVVIEQVLSNEAQIRIDVSTLHPGMYLVNIIMEGGSATQKLILN